MARAYVLFSSDGSSQVTPFFASASRTASHCSRGSGIGLVLPWYVIHAVPVYSKPASASPLTTASREPTEPWMPVRSTTSAPAAWKAIPMIAPRISCSVNSLEVTVSSAPSSGFPRPIVPGSTSSTMGDPLVSPHPDTTASSAAASVSRTPGRPLTARPPARAAAAAAPPARPASPPAGPARR